jgi:hypothetical protein
LNSLREFAPFLEASTVLSGERHAAWFARTREDLICGQQPVGHLERRSGYFEPDGN